MRIRLAAVVVLMTAKVAVACPTMEGALPLASKDAGAPTAFVSYEGPPVSETFDLIVQFCGEETLADVEFDAVMPAHQHGMNYQPDVETMDVHTYRVSNIVFHMPGLWEIRIGAQASGDRFKYTGEVAVE